MCVGLPWLASRWRGVVKEGSFDVDGELFGVALEHEVDGRVVRGDTVPESSDTVADTSAHGWLSLRRHMARNQRITTHTHIIKR